MSDSEINLPKATVARIAKGAVEDIRLSNEAIQEISVYAEQCIVDTTRKAAAFAKHANRKTIKGSDVKMLFSEEIQG